MNDTHRLYELEFEVEVSALYHDFRRTTLETYSNWIRGISLTGSVLSLIFVLTNVGFGVQLGVAVASAIAATVTLIDLVFRIDSKAVKHSDLYQRFKRLQAEIERRRKVSDSRMDEWRAEAQEIEVDEPPVLWVIYMSAWNQALGKREVDAAELRRVTWYQALLGGFLTFQPTDFPLIGEAKS